MSVSEVRLVVRHDAPEGALIAVRGLARKYPGSLPLRVYAGERRLTLGETVDGSGGLADALAEWGTVVRFGG